MDINKFVYDWMYELLNDMSIMKTEEEQLHDNWEKAVQREIQLGTWKAQYRKVSQLCHYIGGDVLDKFTELFPYGVETYKKVANI